MQQIRDHVRLLRKTECMMPRVFDYPTCPQSLTMPYSKPATRSAAINRDQPKVTLMSRFPRISSPCPLKLSQIPSGPCSACGKSVLNLDAMDESDRRALLASCGRSVCVGYRVPRSAAVAAGLLIAAGVITPAAEASAPIVREPMIESPAPHASGLLPLTDGADPDCDDEAVASLDMIVMVGGVDDPHAAEWVDVDSPALPTLPQADEDMFLQVDEESMSR